MFRSFVVTGCSRSGTTYTSKLLQALGLPCKHERVFNIYKVVHWKDLDMAGLFPPALTCDSSFLAAPLLDQLTERHLVLHQLRNPIEVVRSHIGMRFFREPVEPSYWLADNHDDFLAYIFEHAPLVAGEPDELRRAMRYWVAWNRLVEERSQDSSATYLRYRVEDLTPSMVGDILTLIGADVPTAGAIEQTFAEVSTQTNHRVREEGVTWDSIPDDDLGDSFRATAFRYGYLAE